MIQQKNHQNVCAMFLKSKGFESGVWTGWKLVLDLLLNQTRTTDAGCLVPTSDGGLVQTGAAFSPGLKDCCVMMRSCYWNGFELSGSGVWIGAPGVHLFWSGLSLVWTDLHWVWLVCASFSLVSDSDKSWLLLL